MPIAKLKRIKKLGIGATICLALTGAFLAASLALSLKILFPEGEGYRGIALANAQRVEFSPATGEIEGKLLLLEEAVPQKPAETPPSPEHHPTEEKPSEEKPVEQPHASSEPLTPKTEDSKPAQEEKPTPTVQALPPPAQEIPPPAPAISNLPPIDPVEQRLENGDIVPVANAEQTASTYYAKKPADISATTPRIALILTDLGLSRRISDAAIALPDNVTLSFSPYGKFTRELTASAREKGHEILLDLPLETTHSPAIDPGPDGIFLKQSAAEIAVNFTRTLTKARGYVGLDTPPQDKFSDDPKILDLLDLFHKHGLLMVNSNSAPTPMMFQAGEKTGVAILYSTVFLSKNLDETSIKNELARAEDLSRRYGKIAVNAQSSALTISLLDSWLQTLKGKGIALVPASSVAPPLPKKAVSPYASEFSSSPPSTTEKITKPPVKEEQHGG